MRFIFIATDITRFQKCIHNEMHDEMAKRRGRSVLRRNLWGRGRHDNNNIWNGNWLNEWTSWCIPFWTCSYFVFGGNDMSGWSAIIFYLCFSSQHHRGICLQFATDIKLFRHSKSLSYNCILCALYNSNAVQTMAQILNKPEYLRAYIFYSFCLNGFGYRIHL